MIKKLVLDKFIIGAQFWGFFIIKKLIYDKFIIIY